ncbi:MAG: oligosaccharide flippase family protein [Betaproteobacteria bacterium]|nr:oligosaccharide flippase family protein [Betaproteobacteria bacterium]
MQPTIRALFSGFSRIGDDPEQLRSVVVGVFGLAALLALPASVGVYVLAEPIVLVLLGAKWIGAVPLLQAIAGFGALHAFLAPVGILSLATGMARFVIGLTFVNAIIAIPTFAILLNRTNLVSATIALLAIGFLCGLINLLVAMRRVSVSADCLWKGVWRPALGVLVMSGILQYASTPGWSTAEGSLHTVWSHGRDGCTRCAHPYLHGWNVVDSRWPTRLG